MRILADECCNAPLVEALRMDGHDVVYALESYREASDEQILRTAVDEKRILITVDSDFGDLVFRQQLPSYGVVLLRYPVVERENMITRTRNLIRERAETLAGRFVVVEPGKTRSRPINL